MVSFKTVALPFLSHFFFSWIRTSFPLASQSRLFRLLCSTLSPGSEEFREANAVNGEAPVKVLLLLIFSGTLLIPLSPATSFTAHSKPHSVIKSQLTK